MNNKQILTRMKSIRQTVQISSAQKLVAASHIGKARRILSESEPFHARIRQAIAEVLAVSPELSSRYLDKGDLPAVRRRGVLVISSDRGLAGGYNSNLMKFTERTLGENKADYLLVLGKIGQKHLLRAGYDVDASFPAIIDPPARFSAGELAQRLIRLYDDERVDCFDVIYTQYTSAVRLEPVLVRVLPLKPEEFGQSSRKRLEGDVVFEPNAEAVLRAIVPRYLKGFLYGCFIHAWTSELASRITAMDNAVRNGNEMLDSLSLAYNRARQGSITQEITEIVAGAAAMADKD